jgi:hypothetical protein
MAQLIKTLTSLEPIPWDGQPIKNPGIYNGIPIEAYHSGEICVEPSISSSHLRKIYSPHPQVTASPAHYWCRSPYNPERSVEDDEESKALLLGRAAHHLLFAQEDFRKSFAIRPVTINGESCNRVTRQGKLWHQRQEDAGLTIITQDQLAAIKGIGRELFKESLVQRGLLNGNVECSWFWKHASGVWLKIRPDASPKDSLNYVDLKLTRSIMWPSLQYTIRDYGYFMQAGLVAMGVKAITGQNLETFSLVFAENTEPHCIEIVTFKDGDIKRGVDACEIAIAKFNKCWVEKRWPGPRGDREEAQWIEMTEFDQKRIDEQIVLDRK